ncbi:MAG TPA: hypothetical protein VNR51_02130 [Hyphomicrobium sp.]|nr:hypothetical protein [Hyphomicrobium sp.]
MPLPITPQPTNARPQQRPGALHWRHALGLAFSALLAFAAPSVALAMQQQAPNSRVVLDLPPEYVPSPLFSGFQNETTGASFVILEAPAAEYDKMAQGFTAEELGKRGITDVTKGSLPRSDAHIYMRAKQTSEAGTYGKFFVLFRSADQTVLVSVNVPQHALADASVKVEDIEKVLATARTTEKPAVRDLFALSYLGPFKEAGRIVGTSKVYTLDGRLEPERAGETRSAFMVAPSIDKRVITEPEKQAVALLGSLPGFRDFKPGKPHAIRIGGLDGIEVEAEAVDADDGRPIHLYQAMLLGTGGGYFRLIGIAAPGDAPAIAPEFPKIAHSFSLLP